jgi:hypothetical protein
MNVANRVLWRMANILKANKVNLFVSYVLFVFWYHSPNFLDTPHICDISRLRVNIRKHLFAVFFLMLGWPWIPNYMAYEQQPNRHTFIFSSLSYHTSTSISFGHIISPSLGGRMYICGMCYTSLLTVTSCWQSTQKYNIQFSTCVYTLYLLTMSCW